MAMSGGERNVIAGDLATGVAGPGQVRPEGFAANARHALNGWAMFCRRLLEPIDPGPNVALLHLSGRLRDGTGEAALPACNEYSFFERGHVHAPHNTTIVVSVNHYRCLILTTAIVRLF